LIPVKAADASRAYIARQSRGQPYAIENSRDPGPARAGCAAVLRSCVARRRGPAAFAAGMALSAPACTASVLDEGLAAQLARSGLAPLRLAGRLLLPLVQGGMGVGVSAHRLAGAVAALGAVGTISSVDLRRLHPDLMARTADLGVGAAAKAAIDAANLEAIEREIAAARRLAGGRGLLAINIMRAVSAYAASVRRALEAGIDAVVVGAGLPLDLPDLAQDHPRAALIPILSDARGVQLIVKKWERKRRLPDAIVIEHPRLAGGHLGAAKVADLQDPRFDFENVLPQSIAFLRSAGVEAEVPLIVAGGIRSCADIARVQALGAAAVQLGTPFAVTTEGDAHPEFKRVLAEARDEDIVEFTSVAGLPARAVATPWLRSYLAHIDRLQAVAHPRSRCTKAFDCLQQCGLRDGLAGWGQFCIDNQLAAALRGDVQKGLFFRGAGALPFGNQIRSVRELVERLLTPGPVAAIA
jgi:nitronate monooxygenase